MRIVKVLIGEPESVPDDEKENVIHPIRRARVLLENGAIFDRLFNCVQLEMDYVVKNFKEEERHWKRFDPYASKKNLAEAKA